MVEDNIEFTIKDEFGHDINCFIFVSKNINNEEINVLFNQDNDNDDIVRYGKIIKNGSSYTLSNKISLEELDELKEMLDNEIKNISFKLYNPEEGF